MWTVHIDRRGVRQEVAQIAVMLGLIALLALVPGLHATLGGFFAVAILLLAVFAFKAAVELVVALLRLPGAKPSEGTDGKRRLTSDGKAI